MALLELILAPRLFVFRPVALVLFVVQFIDRLRKKLEPGPSNYFLDCYSLEFCGLYNPCKLSRKVSIFQDFARSFLVNLGKKKRTGFSEETGLFQRAKRHFIIGLVTRVRGHSNRALIKTLGLTGTKVAFVFRCRGNEIRDTKATASQHIKGHAFWRFLLSFGYSPSSSSLPLL